MSENNGNGGGRARARVRCAHIYLSEGLVEEAEAELALLLGELEAGVAELGAKSNGGGRPEGPATKPRRKGGRPRKAKAEPDKPSRPSPEQEARAVAEQRSSALAAGMPPPVAEGRSARAFTPEERAQVAEYAREHTITKACEVFNLSWPCVRDWIDKYPRSALAAAGAAS